MDKLRRIKTYFLQQISETQTGSIGDQTLQTLNDFMKMGVIGFDYLKHVIFQEFNITPQGGNFTVNLGLKGGIAVDTGSGEDVLVGVYKGIRADQGDPYTEDSVTFDGPDAQDRIDLIQAEVVFQDDPDFTESVIKLDTGVQPPAEVSVPEITRRVQEVIISVKKGTPAGSPVAPDSDAGHIALREVYIANGAAEIFPADIEATTLDPLNSPWTSATNIAESRRFPAIFESWDILGYQGNLVTSDNANTNLVSSINEVSGLTHIVSTQAGWEDLWVAEGTPNVWELKPEVKKLKVLIRNDGGANSGYDVTALNGASGDPIILEMNDCHILECERKDSSGNQSPEWNWGNSAGGIKATKAGCLIRGLHQIGDGTHTGTDATPAFGANGTDDTLFEDCSATSRNVQIGFQGNGTTGKAQAKNCLVKDSFQATGTTKGFLGFGADGSGEILGNEMEIFGCRVDIAITGAEAANLIGFSESARVTNAIINLETNGAGTRTGVSLCTQVANTRVADSDTGFDNCFLLDRCVVILASPGFFQCKGVTNCYVQIIMEQGIGQIGFDECNNLDTCEVRVGGVATSQNNIGFRECRYLSSCSVENTFGTAGLVEHAFEYCYYLSSCYGNTHQHTFTYCIMLSSCAGVCRAGDAGFWNCENLTACRAIEFELCDYMSGCNCDTVNNCSYGAAGQGKLGGVTYFDTGDSWYNPPPLLPPPTIP